MQKDIDAKYEEDYPRFIRKEFIKDAQGRRPEDPNYDPTTLFIPLQDWQKFSPTMRQYWSVKSKHFDKIVFFKMGKFYEVFYDDAEICH